MAIKKNTNDLISQAATTLADNSTQDISPQDVREMAENNAFSSYNKITDNNLVGLKNYSTAATYEAAQGVVYNGSIYISNTIPTPGAFNASEWDLLSGGEINTSSNSGAGEGLALAKSGSNLPFKSLTAGTGITLTSAANELQISSAGGTDTNIGNANLTFDGDHNADLNGNDWEVKNGSTGSALKLQSTVSGKAKFYTNGEVVNSAANFAWDGVSNVGLSVTQSGNIIHAWSSQNYKLYTSNGSISLFEVGVTSGASRLDLKLTNGTSFFKIVSNADSYLHKNFLVKGSDNAAATSGFKVTDVNNNSLLDVKNNGRFATNGSNVNSAFNVAYDGTSANGFTVSTLNAIQHALNAQSYTIRNTAGTQDLLKFNVQSAVSKFVLTNTSNTEFFRISNDANSFLSTNLTLGQSAPVAGARFLIRNYGTNSSQQSFFGNITMNTAGRLGSSGSFGTTQKGFECFDTDKNKKFFWNGSAWEKIKGNIESVTQATATTLTPNIDNSTMEIMSSLAAALTIAAPTGTPHEGQELTFRFKDDGTARALTWNAIFEDYTGSLPTTTTAGKTVYIGCKYNLINTKWDVVAVQTQP